MSPSPKSWVKVDRLAEPAYRVLHFVLSRFTILRNQPGRVIIIKLFGMGSIIRLLSMCEERSVDLQNVTLITSYSNKELCHLWGLNCLFVRTTSIRSLLRDCIGVVRALISCHPRLIVDLERCSSLVGIFRTIAAWTAGCKTISFERRASQGRKSVVHHVDTLTQEQIFLEGIRHLPLGSEARHSSRVEIDQHKVIVNVNTSDLLEARKYALVSFAEAIKMMSGAQPQLKFYLSGVQSERAYVQQLVDDLAGLPVHNVAGEWSLSRLVKELSNCGLLITGDSAPLHLGSHLNVTTLSLWGPTQPAHFGYNTTGVFSTMSLSMPCSPCFLHPKSQPAIACKGAITCMKFKAGDVTTRALELLSSNSNVRTLFLPANMQVAAPHLANALG